MLQSMRSAISSWSIRILLFILLLSFVSFYGWRSSDQLSSSEIASVGGESILVRDFHIQVQQRADYFRRLGILKSDLSEDMLQNFERKVLESMIQERLLSNQAKKIGFVASPQQIRERIQKEFENDSGTFDFELYKTILERRLNTTTAAYENNKKVSFLAQNFSDLLQRTTSTSLLDLKSVYAIRNEKVSLQYVWLHPSKVSQEISKNSPWKEEEIKSYFDQNQQKYQIPETRKLHIAWITLQDWMKPSEAELEQIFKEQFPENSPKAQEERVRAAHILLRSQPQNEIAQRNKAQELYLKLKKGADFSDLARVESEDPSRIEGGDLGYFGHGDMVETFEKVAFSLPVGSFSKPVQSPFGFHIIKALDRIPAGPREPKRLKRELSFLWYKKLLQNPKERERWLKNAEEGIRGWKPSEKNSKIKQIQTDFVKMGDLIPTLPETRDSDLLLSSARNLKKGVSSQPIRSGSGQYVYVFLVSDLKETQAPSLESVREKVIQDLNKEFQENAFQKYCQNLLEEWKTSKLPLEKLAKKKGWTVESTGEFTRSGDNEIPKLGKSPEIMKEAFQNLPPASFLSKPFPIGSKTYFVWMEKKIHPDWALFEKEKKNLMEVSDQEQTQERLEAWIRWSQNKTKIKRNLG